MDLKDCQLIGYQVFSTEGKSPIRYSIQGKVQAYVQFQQANGKQRTENGTGPILAIEVSRHGSLRVAGLRVPPRDARPTRRAVRRFQAETLGNPFLPFRRAIRPPALDAAA